jgi:hypothetical protein
MPQRACAPWRITVYKRPWPTYSTRHLRDMQDLRINAGEGFSPPCGVTWWRRHESNVQNSITLIHRPYNSCVSSTNGLDGWTIVLTLAEF